MARGVASVDLLRDLVIVWCDTVGRRVGISLATAITRSPVARRKVVEMVRWAPRVFVRAGKHALDAGDTKKFRLFLSATLGLSVREPDVHDYALALCQVVGEPGWLNAKGGPERVLWYVREAMRNEAVRIRARQELRERIWFRMTSEETRCDRAARERAERYWWVPWPDRAPLYIDDLDEHQAERVHPQAENNPEVYLMEADAARASKAQAAAITATLDELEAKDLPPAQATIVSAWRDGRDTAKACRAAGFSPAVYRSARDTLVYKLKRRLRARAIA